MLGENPPGRLQKLAHRADVDIAFLVKREVSPGKGPVLTYRLVDNWDVRGNLLLIEILEAGGSVEVRPIRILDM